MPGGWASRRVKVHFAGREVEFVDRDAAIKQVEEIAEKGARFPIVVYGPESCGKTALLKQVAEVLKKHGYAVAYINPLSEIAEERFSVSEELVELTRKLGAFLPETPTA